MTSVVKLSRVNGKVIQDCDVYIGRACFRGGWNLPASKWANPYALSDYDNDRDEGMFSLRNGDYTDDWETYIDDVYN